MLLIIEIPYTNLKNFGREITFFVVLLYALKVISDLQDKMTVMLQREMIFNLRWLGFNKFTKSVETNNSYFTSYKVKRYTMR